MKVDRSALPLKAPSAETILKLYKAFPGIRRTTKAELAKQRATAHLIRRDKTIESRDRNQIRKTADAASAKLQLWPHGPR